MTGEFDWPSLYANFLAPAAQIGILGVVIYWVLLALERIAAAVKLRGLAVALIVIVLAALAAEFARMHAITWLLRNAISFSIIILAVVFQPEVRRLFTRMGGLLSTGGTQGTARTVQQIVEAAQYMAARRIGALIVLERTEKLDEYAASHPLDCQVNAKLMCSVFWKDTPLHDGALIIQRGRITAAGVILPLTENYEYKYLSGTRHRAGIGISEETDALAILVSEETGTISVADRGKLTRDLSIEDLEIVLGRLFGQIGLREAST